MRTLYLIPARGSSKGVPSVYKVDLPCAVLESNNNVVKAFKEKPTYIYDSSTSVYLLKRELISRIPKNTHYDITDLMDNLIEEGDELLHNPIRGYWVGIVTPIDYKNAQEFVKHLHQ